MLRFFCCLLVFCFKQKTAYEMRISDWSSDVCSSDLVLDAGVVAAGSFVGCRAAPILALLVSRRERLCRRDDHHVEVARAQALGVLRGVDKARPQDRKSVV